MTRASQLRTRYGPHLVTRRSLARGAAWSVPVVASLTAAPALAASGPAGLTFFWSSATWRPGSAVDRTNSIWTVRLSIVNHGDQSAGLVSLGLQTTYHAPAVNGTNRIAATADLTGFTAPAGRTTTLPASLLFTVEPQDTRHQSLLPSYYDSYPTGGTGVDCVDQAAYPGDADYPDACQRLNADATSLVLSYSLSGVAGSVTVPFDDRVGCLVAGDCAA